MGGLKIEQRLELNQDHIAWLKRMAEKYGLFDEDKALRVVLDHAMEADEDVVFSEIRCHHCSDATNQD